MNKARSFADLANGPMQSGTAFEKEVKAFEKTA